MSAATIGAVRKPPSGISSSRSLRDLEACRELQQEPGVEHEIAFWSDSMPRKTNYDFERREREKSKAVDAAKKAQAKADKKASGHTASDRGPITGA